MEFMKEILNLPVLVQGALGSFLFWLTFEATKLSFNAVIAVSGQVSSNVKSELKAAEAFHHAHSIFGMSTLGIALHMTSLFVAVNRIIRALIYLCIGLISKHVLGPISSAAYLISIGYLFLALKAVHVEFKSGLSVDERKKQFKKLADELIEADKNDRASGAA